MDTKVISTGLRYTRLPDSYVRPESDRPKLSEVKDCDDVPIIDLGSEDRTSIVQQIGNACLLYGFFQVINHGVSMEAAERMQEVAHEFFLLPVEEKMKLYSDDPAKTMRLSTSFNVKKETVHNWRDYLRLHCYPLDQYVPEWPSNPSSFKDTVSDYCKQVRELGFRLQELIAESLGLEKDHIKDALGEQGQHMAVNYYPPCPQPDLTYGLPGHTDPNALTILLQDLQVSGLQVLKDGKWMAFKAHPKAFVINIGDQLQQVQVVIRSLPSTTAWDNMSQNLTHNENLKTFEDVERHLVLEAERQEAAKPMSSANMIESSSLQASRPNKRKYSEISNKKGGATGPAPKRAKIMSKPGGQKSKAKQVCYNCNKEGHFAGDCTEPKKILSD